MSALGSEADIPFVGTVAAVDFALGRRVAIASTMPLRARSNEQPNHLNYVLGQSDHEYERLMLQARILRPYTEKFFRAEWLALPRNQDAPARNCERLGAYATLLTLRPCHSEPTTARVYGTRSVLECFGYGRGFPQAIRTRPTKLRDNPAPGASPIPVSRCRGATVARGASC
jgi:hypothetical protein